MKFNPTRWIPVILLAAALGGLIFISNPNIPTDQAADSKKLPVIEPAKEYKVPSNLKNPFEYKEDLPPVTISSTTVSTSTAKGTEKIKAKPQQYVVLDGIFWTPPTPMISLNGKLLSNGGKLRNIEVVKIYPDKVILKIDGRTVTKRMQ